MHVVGGFECTNVIVNLVVTLILMLMNVIGILWITKNTMNVMDLGIVFNIFHFLQWSL